jgi:hypothetical protein
LRHIGDGYGWGYGNGYGYGYGDGYGGVLKHLKPRQKLGYQKRVMLLFVLKRYQFDSLSVTFLE